MKKYSILKPHIKKEHGIWLVVNIADDFTFWGGLERLEKAVEWCKIKNKAYLGI